MKKSHLNFHLFFHFAMRFFTIKWKFKLRFSYNWAIVSFQVCRDDCFLYLVPMLPENIVLTTLCTSKSNSTKNLWILIQKVVQKIFLTGFWARKRRKKTHSKSSLKRKNFHMEFWIIIFLKPLKAAAGLLDKLNSKFYLNIISNSFF